MKWSTRSVSSIAVSWVVLVSCGDSVIEPALPTAVDSAGVRVVENGPIEDLPMVDLSEAPVRWSYGGAPDAIPMDQIRGAVALSDTLLAVLNGVGREVLLFNAEGEFRGSLGRPGDGPGEIGRASGIFSCSADTLAVYGSGRLDLFSSSGFVRRIPTAGPLAVAPDCSGALVTTGRTEPAVGSTGWLILHQAWVRWGDSPDTTALFSDSIPSTLTRLPPWGGEPYTWLSPFSYEPVSVGGDGDVVQGQGWSPELRVHSVEGQLRAIYRWRQEPGIPSPEDRRSWDAKRTAHFERVGRNAEAEFVFPDWDEWADETTAKPSFERIARDEADRLWVLLEGGGMGIYDPSPPVTSRRPEEWLILSNGGSALGRITMPATFRFMTLWNGRVVGVETGEFDVQTIAVYELPAASLGGVERAP